MSRATRLPGNLRNHRKFARGFFHETEALVYDTDAAKGMARMLDRGELPWPERRVRRQRQVVCWYDRMCLKTTRTPSENVAVIQASRPEPSGRGGALTCGASPCGGECQCPGDSLPLFFFPLLVFTPSACLLPGSATA